MDSPYDCFDSIEIFLGLGANIGDPAANLKSAFSEIKCRILKDAELSSLYITEPQDVKKQPEFVNAACTGLYSGSAFDLHNALSLIENDLGRNRNIEQRRGRRMIDIDILYFGGMIIDYGRESEGEGKWLRIPHERLRQRKFALVPLLELAPELVDPASAKPYSYFNDLLSGQGIYTFDAVSYIKAHGAES
ncbi:MAG TPA: 2-amino-4-hydroxy-6-hydroxymethyldihydropteridine diphosphokinase [Spirochaeta sp.]|nr:2-amino-4-hydroxy-6-hydroxymethyldihydropteridine diphosphokinase [Spirochaeta sp.]